MSLDVEPGEAIGLIGHNGAGKSTLLKLLSRITPPSEGRITLRGRVASLLEVGTGFHPELTGRENIFLNGAILGMRRREIAAKYDAIVEFSGIERFIDTPVKRYSSGMYVRLAFAVAAHLEPEILLVDEVLAVGRRGVPAQVPRAHAGGRRRAGGRSSSSATTSPPCERLCSRAAFVESGRLALVGPSDDVVDALPRAQRRQPARRRRRDPGGASTRAGDGRARLRAVELCGADGRPAGDVIRMGRSTRRPDGLRLRAPGRRRVRRRRHLDGGRATHRDGVQPRRGPRGRRRSTPGRSRPIARMAVTLLPVSTRLTSRS